MRLRQTNELYIINILKVMVDKFSLSKELMFRQLSVGLHHSQVKLELN